MVGTKEPVRLRMKELKGGGASLYLDIYSDGQRTYEFLKLYLVPESEEGAKARNRETMRIANVIKARRILELQEGRAGLTHHVGNSDLFTFARSEMMKRDGSTRLLWGDMIRHLTGFCKCASLSFTRVTPDWVNSFLRYMFDESGLSKNSAITYFNYFAACLNAAHKRGFIAFRPSDCVKCPQHVESPRSFLTADEVARLASAPCPHEVIKRAFLFSCYSGLRRSDVFALRWDCVTINEDGTAKIILTQKKTRAVTSVEIPPFAVSLLGADDGTGRGLCFDNLAGLAGSFTIYFRSWAAAAKITKRISFHTARHTFATLLLNEGVDLYVVSKLLGHADVKTTQVYAKIMDSTKREAMSKLANVLQKCQTSNKTKSQNSTDEDENEKGRKDHKYKNN